MRDQLIKAIFTFALVSICAVAGLALSETPAEAMHFPALSNCPHPTTDTDGMIFIGTCDIWADGCHLQCEKYRDSNGTLYYNTDECYAT